MTDQQAPHTQQHPIGTLVIVGVYGLLLVAGWLAVYFFIFRQRGMITP